MINRDLKKTKIIATLGPASSSRETMIEMIKEGVDVFRINFSHADYDLVKKNVELIRSINKEYGFNTAILGDLQGPKLRVGVVKEGSFINPGDILTFTNENVEGDASRVYMTYERFAKDVKVGERILIDDGKLVFEVIETNQKDIVKAKAIQGGPLSSKKGVNLPNTAISLPALTEKDIEDAKFMLDNEFDWIALSFVRHAQDIKDLKDLTLPQIALLAGMPQAPSSCGSEKISRSSKKSRQTCNHRYTDDGNHDQQPDADSCRGE